MNKKILWKYIFMYIPVFLGGVLFLMGIVNLFSSLLLFLGGYIAIKNTFDYRMLRKNINRTSSVSLNKKDNIKLNKVDVKKTEIEKIKSMSHDNIIGLKRVRRYGRVRRKY